MKRTAAAILLTGLTACVTMPPAAEARTATLHTGRGQFEWVSSRFKKPTRLLVIDITVNGRPTRIEPVSSCVDYQYARGVAMRVATCGLRPRITIRGTALHRRTIKIRYRRLH